MKVTYIGLGKMGSNMVKRMLEKGYEVAAFDKNPEAVKEAEDDGAKGAETLEALAGAFESPRTFWIMVPHQFVGDVLEELKPHLEEGDTIIEAGNSPYQKSVERAKEMSKIGVRFMDVGVSGGPSGAREGACMMVGGEREVFEEYETLFKDLNVEGGYGYMGKPGAGHFVKMVHNGIEYGMMQAIAEGFAVMKASDFELDLEEVARVYNHGSVIESNLIGWMQSAYKEEGQELERISGEVSHSGEGKWTVEEAQRLGVSTEIIERSLQFREDSQGNPSYTGKAVSAPRNQFGGHDVSKGGE